jgi:hypothetical protein
VVAALTLLPSAEETMPVARTRLSSCFTLLALAALGTSHLAAQVPVGTAVIGTYSGPNNPGTSGLFLVPLAGGAPTPITGFPTTTRDFASVAFRSRDGAILAGTVASAGGPTGGQVELRTYHLAGSAIVNSSSVVLGTTGTTAGIWVAVLPNDKVLVAGGPFISGPMTNSLLAIVDTSTATVTPLPNPPGTGSGGGIAVDGAGRYVYYLTTTNVSQPTRVATMYRWDLTTFAGCASAIASWPGELANGLVCDDDGTIYVSATNLNTWTHSIHAVTPNGCGPATVVTIPTNLTIGPSGIALDRRGNFLVTGGGFAPGLPIATNLNQVYLVDRNSGIGNLLAGGPTTWGFMGASHAVNNAIDSYGACTDRQNHFWFDNFPNLGGQPNSPAGNPNFSLTMRSSPGTAMLSAIAVSFGRGSTPLLGAVILVDLNSAVTTFLVPSTASTYSLPLPAGFPGLEITAQTLHLEPGNTLATSRGLSIRL